MFALFAAGVGKLVGILRGAAAVRLRPAGLSWRDVATVATLGGAGFTVSRLLAEPALPPGAADQAKKPPYCWHPQSARSSRRRYSSGGAGAPAREVSPLADHVAR